MVRDGVENGDDVRDAASEVLDWDAFGLQTLLRQVFGQKLHMYSQSYWPQNYVQSEVCVGSAPVPSSLVNFSAYNQEVDTAMQDRIEEYLQPTRQKAWALH